MILASAILLAVQSAPPPTAESPSFALPFATGQLVMSYLDGPPHCRAEGRGAFVEPARHVCERIEPTATPPAASDPRAHALGGMIVEVQREGQTAPFPVEVPQSLPIIYDAVAEIEVGPDGRVAACHDVSEDRHGNGGMFGTGGMCAEMMRDPHPYLADPTSPAIRRGRVTLRSFAAERPAAQR